MINLQCPSSNNGSFLIINWNAPIINADAVSSYLVNLLEYSPIEGSRELELTSIGSQELGPNVNEAGFTQLSECYFSSRAPPPSICKTAEFS